MTKVFKLKDTLAQKHYRGCGLGLLSVRGGVPEDLIYADDDFCPENPSVENLEVFYGMVSCYEFVVERKLKLW